jgi:hypothetical protein
MASKLRLQWIVVGSCLMSALLCGCKKEDPIKVLSAKTMLQGTIVLNNIPLKAGKVVVVSADDFGFKADSDVKMNGKYFVKDPPEGKVKIYYIPPEDKTNELGQANIKEMDDELKAQRAKELEKERNKKGAAAWDKDVSKVSKEMFEIIQMCEKVPERFRAPDTTTLETELKAGMNWFEIKFPIK